MEVALEGHSGATEDELHLRRFLIGHRLNLLMQLSLSHG